MTFEIDDEMKKIIDKYAGKPVDLEYANKILFGKTIGRLDCWYKRDGEMIFVITTNEPFQMIKGHEGSMTNQYVFHFDPKDIEEEE